MRRAAGAGTAPSAPGPEPRPQRAPPWTLPCPAKPPRHSLAAHARRTRPAGQRAGAAAWLGGAPQTGSAPGCLGALARRARRAGLRARWARPAAAAAARSPARPCGSRFPLEEARARCSAQRGRVQAVAAVRGWEGAGRARTCPSRAASAPASRLLYSRAIWPRPLRVGARAGVPRGALAAGPSNTALSVERGGPARRRWRGIRSCPRGVH
jgi:hypothetical protein